jgi:putative zinc finger/helix-turn-helix YgiT family protein
MLLNRRRCYMESYCDVCGKIVSYEVKEEKVVENIDGEEISYIGKYDICNNCGNKFYSEDTYNYNVISSSNEIRKKNGLITTVQIEEILNKYNIGKKPLSLVLGWGEITITRYETKQIQDSTYDMILRMVQKCLIWVLEEDSLVYLLQYYSQK